MEGFHGLLRRLVRRATDAVRGHGALVGTRHPRSRDHVGRGGAEAPAAHPPRWYATAVLRALRRHRRVQRRDDGAEERPLPLRGAAAAGRHPPPADRLRPERPRRSIHLRNALPASPPARHVQPLPQARGGDTELAGAARARARTAALIVLTGATLTSPRGAARAGSVTRASRGGHRIRLPSTAVGPRSARIR